MLSGHELFGSTAEFIGLKLQVPLTTAWPESSSLVRHEGVLFLFEDRFSRGR